MPCRALITLLLLCSCGSDADYVTKQGTRVYLEGTSIPKEHVEQSLSSYLEVVGSGHKFLQNTTLALHGYEVNCGKGNSRRGCWVYSDMMALIYIFGDCLGRTSIAHELTHGLQNWQTGEMDHKHKVTKYWGDNGIAEATETVLLRLCE